MGAQSAVWIPRRMMLSPVFMGESPVRRTISPVLAAAMRERLNDAPLALRPEASTCPMMRTSAASPPASSSNAARGKPVPSTAALRTMSARLCLSAAPATDAAHDIMSVSRCWVIAASSRSATRSTRWRPTVSTVVTSPAPPEAAPTRTRKVHGPMPTRSPIRSGAMPLASRRTALTMVPWRLPRSVMNQVPLAWWTEAWRRETASSARTT